MTYSGGNRYGSIKSSKSGDQLCSALGGTSNGTTVELLDFDNATGVISNPVVIADNSQASTAYSSEFSPDGTKLYVTAYNQGDIFQYDITSGNSATIMSSKIVITTGPGNNSSMQIGPDDKIYVSRYNAKYLGVINFPDVAGTNCNYDPSGVYLNNGKCMLGLPNFVQGCGGYNTAPSTCQAIFKETITCDTTFFYDYSSISANASVVSWHWDFGDGTTSTQQNPIHIYANNAYYNVCLTITTSDSCSSTTCKTIYYNCPSQPSSCQASYYSYPDTVFDCHTTYFADNSTATSNIVSWSWDFGDGTNSYLQYPMHTYAAVGIYNVCLTIMTADSCMSTYCDTVSISCNPQPQCQAGFYPDIDTTNCFTAYFYNNSTASSNILAWNWSFGDGNMSSLQHPTHVYTANGTYTVCLNIVAADGCTSTYCDTIVISCVITPPCQANFTAILDTNAGNNMTFNFINQSTSQTPIIYQLWDYGDGNLTTAPNPTYTYASSGSYQVCLTILTMDSCTSEYCDSVYIAMTSSINDIFMEGKLSIFPNPANSTVQVTFDVPNGQEYDLVMFNVTGQRVRRMHDFYNGAVKIDRNELSKGLYFIEVEVNGQINRGKLIFK
jgi:PKD repeat protein